MGARRPEWSSERKRRQWLRTTDISLQPRQRCQRSDVMGKCNWLLQGAVVLGESGLYYGRGKEALEKVLSKNEAQPGMFARERSS